MSPHRKVYSDFFHIGPQDQWRCEMCRMEPMDDVHHIVFRSHGGNNEIENLIGLCRWCHNRAHGTMRPALAAEELTRTHLIFVNFFRDVQQKKS